MSAAVILQPYRAPGEGFRVRVVDDRDGYIYEHTYPARETAEDALVDARDAYSDCTIADEWDAVEASELFGVGGAL